MQQIFLELDRWQEGHEQIALATLLRVHGSAPRPPGARLLLTRTGKMAGSISGGCIENDVYERALQVLDTGRAVIATYGISDEMGLGVGLSCGGTIDVLIEPFAATEVWNAVRRAIEERRPVALATCLTPASLLGRKMAILGDAAIGSIDPDLDQQVALEGRQLLSEGGTRFLTLTWQGEEGAIFVEGFPPPLRLFIVGATHNAIPLGRMAKELGFRVAVVDARAAFATTARFPDADEVLQGWPHEVLQEAKLDAHSYVVILAHDPKFDIPALAEALRSRACYIGALGSRVTHEQRVVKLREQGLSTTDLARVRAPIGLDIGARSPAEIAVAILAEMLAVRYGRHGRPLAERRSAIYADD